MLYNFDGFDIEVNYRKGLGLYFIPRNYKRIVTKKEVHNAIDYIKKELNIENNNGVGYHKKAI